MWNMDGGVMITGSHNAAEYNGFELGIGPSRIFAADIQKVRSDHEQREFVGDGRRGSITIRPVLLEYREFILSNFKFGRSSRSWLTAATAAAASSQLPLLREMGLEMFIDMDGRFPNHHPGPTVEANMQSLIAAVRSSGAVAGIAYEGDADRIGVIDENGRSFGVTSYGAVFTGDFKPATGSTIIGEVKVLQAYVRRHQPAWRPIMWKTAHSRSRASSERRMPRLRAR